MYPSLGWLARCTHMCECALNSIDGFDIAAPLPLIVTIVSSKHRLVGLSRQRARRVAVWVSDSFFLCLAELLHFDGVAISHANGEWETCGGTPQIQHNKKITYTMKSTAASVCGIADVVYNLFNEMDDRNQHNESLGMMRADSAPHSNFHLEKHLLKPKSSAVSPSRARL